MQFDPKCLPENNYNDSIEKQKKNYQNSDGN